MNAQAKILAMMIALQSPTDESEHKRYEVIARSIAWETWRDVPSKRSAIRRYLVTAFYWESRFRKDVHSGKLKGDCDWTGGRIGKGKRIPGTCRSACLGQVLFDPPTSDLRVNGKTYKQRDLVGVDLQSTRRCVQVSSELFRRAFRRCESGSPFCVFGTYGGVKYPRRHKLIRLRVGTYNKLRGMAL